MADYTSKELLNGLAGLIEKGEKVLLARADIASNELSDGLKRNGIDFEELTTYRTVMDESMKSIVKEYLKQNKVDFITFASSSTVKNFIEILGKENIELLSNTKIVCIGPVTAQTAKELGLFVSAVADKYTVNGLVDKIMELSGE